MTRPADYQKYRSDRQISRILALLEKGPATAKQVAAHLGLTTSAVLGYTKELQAAPRRIHIAGFAPPPSGIGRPAPMYGAGDRPDAVYTPKRKPKLGDRLKAKRELVLKALETPCTSEQLGAKIFVTTSRARFYIRELRLAKKAYIFDWTVAQKQGDIAPIYALGNKRDKKKPRKSRAMRYKQEMADEDRRDRIRSQRVSRDTVARMLKRKHGVFSALGVHP